MQVRFLSPLPCPSGEAADGAADRIAVRIAVRIAGRNAVKPTADDILAALPDPAALLDDAGRIELAHPALARLAAASRAAGDPDPASTDPASLVGADFFELLRDLSGIAGAAKAFARAGAGADLHASFAVARVDAGADTGLDPGLDATQRYRLQLHALGAGPGGTRRVLALFRAVGGEDQLEDRARALEERMDRVRDLKHELSNAAMGLVGHAELLQQQVAPDHPLRGRVDRLREHSRDVRDLVQALGDALTGTRRRSGAADGPGRDAPPPDVPPRA